jgi:trans-aconitate methyltransferase
MDRTATLASWDRQQEGYMADRDQRFAVIADVVAHVAGDAPTVLDLCCGPGSLGQRLLARLPDARIVAVDADPVLQLIGRDALADDRITWVEHDLDDPGWEQAVGGPFDAVVSTTALHWLSAPTLVAVLAATGRLLRPRGVLADGDHLSEPAHHPRLRALQEALRVLPADERTDYATWWAELEASAADDPDLAAAFARRPAVGTGHPEGRAEPVLPFYEAALRQAGFAEVGTVWQSGDDRVLVALR